MGDDSRTKLPFQEAAIIVDQEFRIPEYSYFDPPSSAFNQQVVHGSNGTLYLFRGARSRRVRRTSPNPRGFPSSATHEGPTFFGFPQKRPRNRRQSVKNGFMDRSLKYFDRRIDVTRRFD